MNTEDPIIRRLDALREGQVDSQEMGNLILDVLDLIASRNYEAARAKIESARHNPSRLNIRVLGPRQGAHLEVRPD
jgi:hypothetical protein